MTLPARLLSLAVLLTALPASAQDIEVCDARWLDELRLRASLQGEIASLPEDALDGVTFVVTACTRVEAEARIVRAGVVVERRLVDVADVMPAMRARLLAMVLAELVRVSGEPASTPTPTPAAAPPPAPERYTDARDDRELPPMLTGHGATTRDDGATSARTLPSRASFTLDSGVRWFPREWSRLISARGRMVWRHLVLEGRYSRGPTLYSEGELPSSFAVVELGVGPRLAPRAGRTEMQVAALATAGFTRPIGGEDPLTRTPVYGAMLSLDATHALAREGAGVLLTAGFDLGYIRGKGEHEPYARHAPVGEMNGMTFGLHFGLGFGVLRGS